MSTDCAGFVPHVTVGRIVAASSTTSVSNVAPSSVTSERQSSSARSHVGALRRELATFEVRERRVVGRDHPGARAGLDRHVADRHAPFHRQRADRRPAVLDDRADAARGAEAVDDREHDVLRGDARGQRAVDGDGQRRRARACGSVWVASTCSTSLVPMPTASAPNAPCVDVWLSPHTIVMPGCVSPCSGPITCTMPWPGCPIAYSRMPNSSQFRASTSICLARDRVAHRLVDVGGGHVVVHRGDGEVGPAHGAAGQAEPVERLRRRDLVHEVEIDVEEVGLAVATMDDVALPHLLGQRLWHAPILPARRERRSQRSAHIASRRDPETSSTS